MLNVYTFYILALSGTDLMGAYILGMFYLLGYVPFGWTYAVYSLSGIISISGNEAISGIII